MHRGFATVPTRATARMLRGPTAVDAGACESSSTPGLLPRFHNMPRPHRAACDNPSVLGLYSRPEVDPKQFFLESLALWQRVANTEYAAGVLSELGRLATRQGDFARAQVRHQEALALRQASADPIVVTVGSSEASIGFGDIARAKGETTKAVGCYRTSLEHLRDVALAQWQRAATSGQRSRGCVVLRPLWRTAHPQIVAVSVGVDPERGTG